MTKSMASSIQPSAAAARAFHCCGVTSRYQGAESAVVLMTVPQGVADVPGGAAGSYNVLGGYCRAGTVSSHLATHGTRFAAFVRGAGVPPAEPACSRDACTTGRSKGGYHVRAANPGRPGAGGA